MDKKIMKKLCWKSLAYCCSLEKECLERDEVIKRLGIKKRDFTELKKEFDKRLSEKIKKRK